MPLNPMPPETKVSQTQAVVATHADLIAQVGLTLTLAVGFTIMGAPPVALGIVIGVIICLAVGLVK
jgi:hypothetical protein